MTGEPGPGQWTLHWPGAGEWERFDLRERRGTKMARNVQNGEILVEAPIGDTIPLDDVCRP